MSARAKRKRKDRPRTRVSARPTMTGAQRLDLWISTPICNIVQSTAHDLKILRSDEASLNAQRRVMCLGSVPWLKRQLGQHDYCWNGEYRFWVWECSLPGVNRQAARIFASNIQGWSFEVNATLDPSKSMAVWRDFVKNVEKV